MKSPDWASYDPVAETYSRIAEPVYFAAVARDLISAAGIQRGQRLLDAGAGTGAVLAAAWTRTGGDGDFTALDHSLQMLRFAGRKVPHVRRIAGGIDRIPCRNDIFDIVTASFVLSHVANLEAALAEVGRVLKEGGRCGLSSWGESPAATAPARLWQEVVREFMDAGVLQKEVDGALPSESRLASPEAFRSLLDRAGFRDSNVEVRSYEVRLSTQDFVDSRLIALPSRFMQATLPADRWEEFVATGRRRLLDQLGPEIELHVSVNLATAGKV
ncbi:MAG TPA: methyltransferase domain-containing protein [Thermoanaerobaculia bacterium]|nr:methyltransferase domain-containing protein [Thermoanaerobaculia bacterium]